MVGAIGRRIRISFTVIPLVLLVLALSASMIGIKSALASTAATTDPPATPANVEVRENLVYREIDGQQLALDACLPKDDKTEHAAILVVHGGGWRNGNKETPQIRDVCELFAQEGFVALSIDYRLAPAHLYPAAIDDLDAAVRWLREPAQVASLRIDPTRIGAFGSSAGGNLVGLLGSRGEGPLTEGGRVSAVVSLSGPMVLTSAAMQFPGAQPQTAEVVLAYLGCPDIEHCPLGADASPITHVDATDPPYLLISSENENRVLPDQAKTMAAALDKVGVENKVILWPGSEHAIALFVHPEIREATLAFLHQHLDASTATPAA